MYPLTHDGVLRICKEQWGVDEHGLSQNDRRYLLALQDGPRGLTAVMALLPVARAPAPGPDDRLGEGRPSR